MVARAKLTAKRERGGDVTEGVRWQEIREVDGRESREMESGNRGRSATDMDCDCERKINDKEMGREDGSDDKKRGRYGERL
jgi:hypothetical protein